MNFYSMNINLVSDSTVYSISNIALLSICSGTSVLDTVRPFFKKINYFEVFHFSYMFQFIYFFAELPETKPHLWADRERYEPGDVLVANCSSPPSRPRVELKLSINNLVVSHFI